MASFVRESKFRHIQISTGKRETFYEQLKVSNHAVDGNGVAGNSSFLAYADSAGSGSAIAVLPLSSIGKNHVPILAPSYQQPLIRAHSQSVQDFSFNPFLRNQLVSCSLDATIKVWNIPTEGYIVDDSTPALSLSSAESTPFRGLALHHAAAGILAARGARDIHLFDFVAGSQIASSQAGLFTADIQSFNWSYNGDLVAVTGKDKRLRLLDLRRSAPGDAVVADAAAHTGTRSSRVVWLGNTPNLLTVGHNSMHEREILLWDSRNMASHVHRIRVDSSTSAPIPFFDEDSGLLVLAGKGDSAVRIFEVVAGDISSGLQPVCNTPVGDVFKGATLLPKQACDLMGCEVLRILKLTDNAIQPISGVVPRKEKLKFQEDLFPPTSWEVEPAVTGEAWAAGTDAVISKKALPRPEASASASGMSLTSPESAAVSEASAGAGAGAGAEASPVVDSEGFSPRSARVKSYGSTMKLRNMYGTETPRSGTFFNIRPNTTNSDSPLIACSDLYWAVPYQGSGGGPVYVSRLDSFGKVEPSCPLINGHKFAVSDIAFSPFHNGLLATAGGDCVVKVWQLPEDPADPTPLTTLSEDDAVATFKNHRHSVRTVNFHPTVANLLATSSQDMTVKLFDVSAGSEVLSMSLDVSDAAVVSNLSFNFDGSLISAACKDRIIRILDPRTRAVALTSPDASTTPLGRNMQAVWCGSAARSSSTILSVCSAASGLRTVHLWDPRNMSETVCTRTIDNASGQLFPLYEESSGVCFVAGKGDTIIRSYECSTLHSDDEPWAGTCERGADFQSNSREPIAGICLQSKRKCDVMNVEVAKLLKLTVDSVQPITFTVPRAEPLKQFFQDDIYGPIRSKESTATVYDWKGFLEGPPAAGPAERSVLYPTLESLQPAGVVALSAKPAEAVSKPSSVRLREEKQREDDEKREREEAFAKMRSKVMLAASVSNTPKTFKVDSKLVDEDSDENDWD